MNLHAACFFAGLVAEWDKIPAKMVYFKSALCQFRYLGDIGRFSGTNEVN
jgi:hypothetical protein